MGNVVLGLAEVIDTLLSIYQWVVIIRALLSFVSPDPRNPVVRALAALTDPLFRWLHRRIPLIYGGLDFAPMVVLLAVIFLKYALVRNLLLLARKLGTAL